MKSSNKSLAPQTAERDSIIVCRTSQGYSVRATPLRITRDVVAFEVYNPYSILQLSEVLKEFRIIVNDQLIYSGRATVSSLVNTGSMLVCEATLDEAWLDVDLLLWSLSQKSCGRISPDFLTEWERINIILPAVQSGSGGHAELFCRPQALAGASRARNPLVTFHRSSEN